MTTEPSGKLQRLVRYGPHYFYKIISCYLHEPGMLLPQGLCTCRFPCCCLHGPLSHCMFLLTCHLSEASPGHSKNLITVTGFPSGSAGKESECRRHRRHGFDPWVRKIPWRRKWQPIFARKTPWAEEPEGLQSRGRKELNTTGHMAQLFDHSQVKVKSPSAPHPPPLMYSSPRNFPEDNTLYA